MSQNPWEQSFAYIFRKGEFLGITLRIWQWPFLFLIVLPPPVLWIVGLLGWLKLPSVAYLLFPLLFIVIIMMPDGHIQGFLDWFGWPYLLRRGDQPLIYTPKLGITLRIALRIINGVNLSWLVFFKDFKTHVDIGIPPEVGLYLGLFGMAFLIFHFLDEKWLFRRTMLSLVFACVLMPWSTVITVNWLWTMYGIAICPQWLPVGLCPE